MIVGVSETFSAAHLIPGHWKCGKVHGHNFKVEVEVEGDVKDGMVIDFYELKRILKEIIDKYDHDLLNKHFENPTSENICLEIFNQLKERGLNVVRVRVSESPDKWVEIRLYPDSSNI